jgi:hypothetical protein
VVADMFEKHSDEGFMRALQGIERKTLVYGEHQGHRALNRTESVEEMSLHASL